MNKNICKNNNWFDDFKLGIETKIFKDERVAINCLLGLKFDIISEVFWEVCCRPVGSQIYISLNE